MSCIFELVLVQVVKASSNSKVQVVKASSNSKVQELRTVFMMCWNDVVHSVGGSSEFASDAASEVAKLGPAAEGSVSASYLVSVLLLLLLVFITA